MLDDRKKLILHNIKQGILPVLRAAVKTVVEVVIIHIVWNSILINHIPVQAISYMNMLFLILALRIALGHVNINIKNIKKFK